MSLSTDTSNTHSISVTIGDDIYESSSTTSTTLTNGQVLIIQADGISRWIAWSGSKL